MTWSAQRRGFVPSVSLTSWPPRLNLAQVERLARALRVAEDKLIRDLVQALGGP